MASGPSYGVLGPAARMAMAAPATVIAPPCCVPGSHAAVAFPAAPAHAPQFRETGGCSSRRPLHTPPALPFGLAPDFLRP